MCYKIITVTHYGCGHIIRTSTKEVDCKLPACRVSLSHKREPHQCQGVCRQQIQPVDEPRSLPQRCPRC